jgi:hypothetical protein
VDQVDRFAVGGPLVSLVAGVIQDGPSQAGVQDFAEIQGFHGRAVRKWLPKILRPSPEPGANVRTQRETLGALF